MDTGLAGQGVVVTGASGGIGAAASERLSRHVTGELVAVAGGMEGPTVNADP